MENQLLQLRFEQLLTGVETMRIAQKFYFKTRTPQALETAKSAEVMVDKIISQSKQSLNETTPEFFNQTTEHTNGK